MNAEKLLGLVDRQMVIDLATSRAAGDVAADFAEREGVEIRGRSHREDLYVLPVPDPQK